MDRYSRVAPARPVCLSGAGPGGHHLLQPTAPSGRRSGGAEIGIFTAERYFNSADAVLLRPAFQPDHHHDPPPPLSRMSGAASNAASQSGRLTAASSEASWNSRSGLLSSGGARHHSAAVARVVKASPTRSASGGGGKKKAGVGSWTLCPCAGSKAVGTVAAAASEPRSPSVDARFSAQSVVDECIESAIFKAVKAPPPATILSGEEEPVAAKMKVTATPGSRSFPLAAALNRGPVAVPSEAFAAAIGRRAAGGFAFPAAARYNASVFDDEPPRPSLEVFRPIDEDSVMLADPPPPMVMPRDRQDLVPPVVADDEALSDASSEPRTCSTWRASPRRRRTRPRRSGGAAAGATLTTTNSRSRCRRTRSRR